MRHSESSPDLNSVSIATFLPSFPSFCWCFCFSDCCLCVSRQEVIGKTSHTANSCHPNGKRFQILIIKLLLSEWNELGMAAYRSDIIFFLNIGLLVMIPLLCHRACAQFSMILSQGKTPPRKKRKKEQTSTTRPNGQINQNNQ